MQKYERDGTVDIELAIGDRGRGIRGSLEAKHGPLAGSSSSVIGRALAGLSGRVSGPGGNGLSMIRQIATSTGGSLDIRSTTGRQTAWQAGGRAADNLAAFPGTQIAVTFRS